MRITRLQISLILIIMAAAAAPAFAGEPLPTHKPNLDVMMIAHRGAKTYAPENTIPAFRKAIELGYNYFESDVRYTKDGVPVLMHDATVNRMTDGEGEVKNLTLEQIKKLDTSSGFTSAPEKFKGTTVPTVEEALQLAQGKIKFYIDQKESPTPELIALLKKYDFLPDNLIVVGDDDKQAEFRAMVPDAPVMPNVEKLEDVRAAIERFKNPTAINVMCTNLTPEIIEAAHSAGVMVFANTMGWCDQVSIMKKMIEMGPDAIQTDLPELMIKVLNKMKKEAGKTEKK